MRKFVLGFALLAMGSVFAEGTVAAKKKILEETVAADIQDAEDEIAVLAEDEQQEELEVEQVAESQ